MSLSSVAFGQEFFVNTLDDGKNVGGWSYFNTDDNSIELLEPDGGHGGAYIHLRCEQTPEFNFCLRTPAPRLRTTVGGTANVFHGDYRDRQVSEIGIDLTSMMTFGPSRPLSLVLRSDGGTPNNPTDDVYIYTVSSLNLPFLDWRSFDFVINPQVTSMPSNWGIWVGNNDRDADWNTVITNVTEVMFYYGDLSQPTHPFDDPWDIGFDNPRIVYNSGLACPADLSGDGALNFFDISIFLNTQPDFNNDGTFNFFDVSAFLTSMSTGCP